MKRRNFLGLLGLGAVAPFVALKGVAEVSRPSPWLCEPSIGDKEFHNMCLNEPYTFHYNDIRSDEFDRFDKKYTAEAVKQIAASVDRAILGRLNAHLKGIS